MKKVIILRHQNEMKFSRDFFQMEVPKELSQTIYVIITICLIIFSVMIFGRIDDVIRTNGFVRTKENVSSVQNVIAGKIVELNYKPGEKVSKGDVLYKACRDPIGIGLINGKSSRSHGNFCNHLSAPPSLIIYGILPSDRRSVHRQPLP